MEQAIGEHVTALAVGSELNLVDGDEVRLKVERHRLDGADVIFRRGGLIFSSPVMSATLLAPMRSTILS